MVALLSGGIDSPVAAWRMMKRGCHVTLVHFHSTPFLSNASQAKARQLAEVLTRYQLRSRLYLVPFGELQRQVTLSVPGDLRVIVYRRLMLRIAQRIARDVRARALVTGDVIGQVASQTLDNMTVIDRATHLTDPPAAGRHGQGGDHHARRSGSARSRFRSCPTRIPARCSRRGIRKPTRIARRWTRRRKRCRSTTWWSPR